MFAELSVKKYIILLNFEIIKLLLIFFERKFVYLGGNSVLV